MSESLKRMPKWELLRVMYDALAKENVGLCWGFSYIIRSTANCILSSCGESVGSSYTTCNYRYNATVAFTVLFRSGRGYQV
jgi:hypothetical protein